MQEKKTIIVTGSVNGIGLSISELAISKGYQVIGIDIEEKVVSGIDQYRADLSSENSIIDIKKRIQNKYPQIHAIINNAAIADPYQKPITELDIEDWDAMLNTNLRSMFLMVKHFSNLLVPKESSIINISSIRSRLTDANTEAYSAAKAGVVGLTHALANSFAHKYRVNSISPGWIQTRVSSTPELKDHKQHLTGRVGKVEDIAQFVMYLISEEASFITGQDFLIDGGVSVKLPYH